MDATDIALTGWCINSIITGVGWFVTSKRARTNALRAANDARRSTLLDNVEKRIEKLIENIIDHLSKPGNDAGAELRSMMLRCELDRLYEALQAAFPGDVPSPLDDLWNKLWELGTGGDAETRTRAALSLLSPKFVAIREAARGFVRTLRHKG